MNSTSPKHEQFLPLWTLNQRRVLGFILTLVPDFSQAEDILQNTSLVVWEKFEQFEPGTEFVTWACHIAYLEVCNFRKKSARLPVPMSDDVLRVVADRAVEHQPRFDDRMKALLDCLDKLSPRDRNLVLHRYEPGGSVQDAAAKGGRSTQAGYKALFRIRSLLFDCVTRRLQKSEVRHDAT